MEEKKNQTVEGQETEEKIVDLETDKVEIEDPVVEETPLEKAVRENEETKNKFLRLQADFENYKKRNRTLSSTMYELGISETIEAIFPVIDSLDNAIQHSSSDKDREGVELIIKKFHEAFEKLGVEEIKALGAEFNPEFHEAVMQSEEEGANPNSVVEVFRIGYKRGNKVIRPSMVKVSK